MDLALSEEQEMLRGLVRELCTDFASSEVVRAMEDDARGVPDELWKHFAEAGLCGLRIAEEYGGSDQGMLECALAYEELGRALAPSPHFPSCVLSAALLRDVGSEAQRAEWLRGIAAGEAILTPAWLEPDGSFAPAGVRLRAERSGEGWRLDGNKRHVVFAAAADRLIVVARTGDGERDATLFLVDPSAEGVSLTQQRSLASDSQYAVAFDGVVVGDDAVLGAPDAGFDALENAMFEAIVPLAALAVGGAERALEITIEYAKQREQFGQPIAAFQSIAHYLADASVLVNGGRTLVHQAAWAHDAGRDVRELAPMAKLFACQTFRDVTKTCQQVWGGVGFTVEFDIQLYFRRAKQLEMSWWDTRTLEEWVARATLDEPAA